MESSAFAYYQLLLLPRSATPPLTALRDHPPPLLLLTPNEQKRPVRVAFHTEQSPTEHLFTQQSLDRFLDSK
jgi:hypothetical protein